MRRVAFILALLLVGLTPATAVRAEPEPSVEARVRSAQQALIGTRRQAELVAPLSARVEAVSVDVGDRVEAGQMLVQLDGRALELTVKQAELEVAAERLVLDGLAVRLNFQEAMVARIAADLESVRKLADAARASSEDVADVETAHAQARADLDGLRLDQKRERVQLELLEVALRAARLDLERTRVVAPFAGVVSAVHVGTGDTARALESPLVTLQDPDRLCVFAEVVAQGAGRWAPGTAVIVRVRLDGRDHMLPARVERVAPSVDVERQWVSVRLTFVEPPPVRLRPGQAVAATLVVADEE